MATQNDPNDKLLDDGGFDFLGKELDPQARVWNVYRDEITADDKAHGFERWTQTLDVLLIFAGLFSAVVTAFLIDSYKLLQKPDNSDFVAAALYALVVATDNSALLRDLPKPSPLSSTPSSGERWVNALWFTSLIIALSVALLAILAKQWLQEFHRRLEDRDGLGSEPTPSNEWTRKRWFYVQGMNQKWPTDDFITYILPLMLHIALFLFLAGLSLFLWSIDHIVSLVVLILSGCLVAIYIGFTLLPLLWPDAPTATPLLNHILAVLNPVLIVILRMSIRALKFLTSLEAPLRESDLSSTDLRCSPALTEPRASQSANTHAAASPIASMQWFQTEPELEWGWDNTFSLSWPLSLPSPTTADAGTPATDVGSYPALPEPRAFQSSPTPAAAPPLADAGHSIIHSSALASPPSNAVAPAVVPTVVSAQDVRPDDESLPRPVQSPAESPRVGRDFCNRLKTALHWLQELRSRAIADPGPPTADLGCSLAHTEPRASQSAHTPAAAPPPDAGHSIRPSALASPRAHVATAAAVPTTVPAQLVRSSDQSLTRPPAESQRFGRDLCNRLEAALKWLQESRSRAGFIPTASAEGESGDRIADILTWLIVTCTTDTAVMIGFQAVGALPIDSPIIGRLQKATVGMSALTHVGSNKTPSALDAIRAVRAELVLRRGTWREEGLVLNMPESMRNALKDPAFPDAILFDSSLAGCLPDKIHEVIQKLHSEPATAQSARLLLHCKGRLRLGVVLCLLAILDLELLDKGDFALIFAAFTSWKPKLRCDCTTPGLRCIISLLAQLQFYEPEQPSGDPILPSSLPPFVALRLSQYLSRTPETRVPDEAHQHFALRSFLDDPGWFHPLVWRNISDDKADFIRSYMGRDDKVALWTMVKITDMCHNLYMHGENSPAPLSKIYPYSSEGFAFAISGCFFTTFPIGKDEMRERVATLSVAVNYFFEVSKVNASDKTYTCTEALVAMSAELCLLKRISVEGDDEDKQRNVALSLGSITRYCPGLEWDSAIGTHLAQHLRELYDDFEIQEMFGGEPHIHAALAQATERCNLASCNLDRLPSRYGSAESEDASDADSTTDEGSSASAHRAWSHMPDVLRSNSVAADEPATVSAAGDNASVSETRQTVHGSADDTSRTMDGTHTGADVPAAPQSEEIEPHPRLVDPLPPQSGPIVDESE